MNDEETVALIAGGHTFGKAHGAASAENVGPDPEAAGLDEQGLGWKNKFGKGNAEHTITSGLEGAWTSTPSKWSHGFFENLFDYDWELAKSPAGAWQWKPTDPDAEGLVPDAHLSGKRHAPMMFTTDLTLKLDPVYGKISRHFYEHPEAFESAFAKAWYKLTHRDMGPVARLLGPNIPKAQLWQDPVPALDYELIGDREIAELKTAILNSDLSIQQLVSTAWASASTYRQSDHRGGANGGRIRLAPQKDWSVNSPEALAKVLSSLENIQRGFNDARKDGVKVSLADLIVLAGGAAIEEAAKRAGNDVRVPFSPGRTDASQAMTDAASFAVLEPKSDGFRNFFNHEIDRPGEELLIDRAHLLSLSAPEMTVLIGGLRVLNTTVGFPQLGVLTDRPETLSNDFFVNLLDINTKWKSSEVCDHFFEGRNRRTGEIKWVASSVDLVFGSNSQLRSIAEVYAAADAEEKFVRDFVAAWTKVMNLDRFGEGV